MEKTVIYHVLPPTLHLPHPTNLTRTYRAVNKLRLDGQNSFYYPDVMVACGPEPRDQYAETAPCLLVEVLSKGTANIDRHAKYAAYTAIPSLQTYLIADQYERRVYAYQRGDASWKLTEYVGAGVIPLPCLGVIGHQCTSYG